MLKRKILVIGDIMLDQYILGRVERISPEAPVPIINVQEERNTLGGAANVANNLAKLNVDVTIFGAISQDPSGYIVEKLIEDNGINSLLVKKGISCTITKTRVIANHQQITRIDRERPLEDKNEILKSINSLKLDDFNLIIISDYAKGVCFKELCEFVIEESKKYSIKVIIDPKGRNWEKYKGADFITPNLTELGDLIMEKIPNHDDDICRETLSIIKKFSFDNVLVTRSEKGMSLINKNACIHFDVKAKEVFDVSGAGDTVVAVLAYALNNDMSIEDSIGLANKAAGFVVSKFGTYAISENELRSLN